MKTFAFPWLGLAVVLVGGLVEGPSVAQAQGFGFAYNSPGFSLGIGRPAYYGGYYPAPVVIPPPIVVAPPPVVYGRPFYPGYGYGYGGYGHGGYRGPYHHGGYGGYPYRRY